MGVREEEEGGGEGRGYVEQRLWLGKEHKLLLLLFLLFLFSSREGEGEGWGSWCVGCRQARRR